MFVHVNAIVTLESVHYSWCLAKKGVFLSLTRILIISHWRISFLLTHTHGSEILAWFFAQIGLISFKLKVYSIQTKTIQAILVAFNSPLSSVSTLAVTFLLYVLFQLKMTSEYFPFQLGRKDVLVGICLFGSILCRFAQGMRWVSVSISGLLHCNP